MFIRPLIATIGLATALLTATPAEAREDGRYVRNGNVAGFHVIVSATPHESLWDTIIVPLDGFPGVVTVKCGSGNYVYNEEIGASSALKIARAWCRH